MENVKLSSEMIVKNKEKSLEKWLDNVKDIVDEIVVLKNTTSLTCGSGKLLAMNRKKKP